MAQATRSEDSLLSLKGVGPRVAEKLQRLDIYSIEQLLFHLPLRYQDRSRLHPLGSLRAGQECQVQGEVQLTEIKFGKRRMLLSRIADGTGFITLRFFHFSNSQKHQLARGVRLLCFGEVRKGPLGLEMVHPEYQVLQANEQVVLDERLTPIYSTTEGVHQLTLRSLIGQAIDKLHAEQLLLQELIPDGLLQQINLPSLKQALLYLHQPPVDADLEQLQQGKHATQQRLIIEELLAHYLSLRQLRLAMQQHQALTLSSGNALSNKFLEALPFQLTNAQQKVIAEINADLAQPYPMQRLVQGDVGSGKTVVAALAALSAIESGYQAVVMAPTELLAEQHFANFRHWLQPLEIQVSWLSGKLKTAERRAALQAIESGQAQLIVGTHALFQEGVNFARLALIIVDEQHRFGVHQRLALREKGAATNHAGETIYPHQLIMTATPIPRTLAMTAYADLDCSTIDELPPGRKPVETVVLPDNRRDEIVQRVERACRDGRQVYWVCPLIEESEALQAQAAEETARVLHEALPEVRVGLVHGRLKSDDKEKIMHSFKAAEIQLLVATTVIEVGVDVPNASLMIIENAERMGLAQLHQLRGRVGRGTEESVCLLMYHGSLSQNARERLAVMRETNDGFVVAQKDLELRGPGEVLGTRQTGMLQMRIADLQRDQAWMPRVIEMARVIYQQQPQNCDLLIQRWIGSATRYAAV